MTNENRVTASANIGFAIATITAFMSQPGVSAAQVREALDKLGEALEIVSRDESENEEYGYANGYATAIETAAQVCENADGYQTINDMPHLIRALSSPSAAHGESKESK